MDASKSRYSPGMGKTSLLALALMACGPSKADTKHADDCAFKRKTVAEMLHVFHEELASNMPIGAIPELPTSPGVNGQIEQLNLDALKLGAATDQTRQKLALELDRLVLAAETTWRGDAEPMAATKIVVDKFKAYNELEVPAANAAQAIADKMAPLVAQVKAAAAAAPDDKTKANDLEIATSSLEFVQREAKSMLTRSKESFNADDFIAGWQQACSK
jgi:hypothetical protein